MNPRFDESLAQLAALKLPIAACVGVAVIAGALLVLAARRRMRRVWSRVPFRGRIESSPYRASTVILGYRDGIPVSLTLTALSCFAFGHLFVPGLVAALASFRFDGIAVPLIPGIGMSLATWVCGWLVVRRSKAAPGIIRLAGVSSLVMNVSLFLMSALHIGYVEISWDHECSSSLAFTSCVFAAASVLQATLMLFTVHRHRACFAASVEGEAPPAAARVHVESKDPGDALEEEEADDAPAFAPPRRRRRADQLVASPGRTGS